MSTNERPSPPTFREILPGPCAEEYAGEFYQMDRFPATSAQIEEAQTICRELCPQVDACRSQERGITRYLWLHGVKDPVVAGAKQTVGSDEDRPASDELSRPAFVFKPADSSYPRHRLERLRQAVRSGQVSLSGVLPPASRSAAAGVIERLKASEPELYESARETLGEAALGRGLGRLCASLQRFDRLRDPVDGASSDSLEPETLFETALCYLADVIQTKELNIRDAEISAVVNDPQLFKDMLATTNARVRPSAVRYALRKDIRFPGKELQRQIGVDAAILAENEGVSATAAVRERTKRSPADAARLAQRHTTVAQLVELCREDVILPEGFARKYVDTRADPVAAAAEYVQRVADCKLNLERREEPLPHIVEADILDAAFHFPTDPMEYLERLSNNITELKKINDPHGLLTDSRIHHLAKSYPHKAVREARDFVKRYDALTVSCAHFLDDKQIQSCALRKCDTAQEAWVFSVTSRLDVHFRNAKNPLERWMCQQLAEIYQQPDYKYIQVRDIAERIQDLRKAQLLTIGTGEAEMLYAKQHFIVGNVHHPRSGNYLAFCGPLRDLSAQERILLAALWGLGRSLYGKYWPKDEALIRNFAGVENLDATTEERLMQKCMRLTAAAQGEDRQPISLTQLSDDLTKFALATNPRLENSAQLPSGTIETVVGATVVTLTLADHEIFGSMPEDQSRFIEQLVSTYNESLSQREAALSLKRALDENIVELERLPNGDYCLVFTRDIIRYGVDAEFAALAHVYGIANVMGFNHYMSDVLGARSAHSSPEQVVETLLRRANHTGSSYFWRDNSQGQDAEVVVHEDTSYVSEESPAANEAGGDVLEGDVLAHEEAQLGDSDVAEAVAAEVLPPPASNEGKTQTEIVETAEPASSTAPAPADAEATSDADIDVPDPQQAWLEALIAATHEPRMRGSVTAAIKTALDVGELVISGDTGVGFSLHFNRKIMADYDSDDRKGIAQAAGYYDVLYEGQLDFEWSPKEEVSVQEPPSLTSSPRVQTAEAATAAPKPSQQSGQMVLAAAVIPSPPLPEVLAERVEHIEQSRAAELIPPSAQSPVPDPVPTRKATVAKPSAAAASGSPASRTAPSKPAPVSVARPGSPVAPAKLPTPAPPSFATPEEIAGLQRDLRYLARTLGPTNPAEQHALFHLLASRFGFTVDATLEPNHPAVEPFRKLFETEYEIFTLSHANDARDAKILPRIVERGITSTHAKADSLARLMAMREMRIFAEWMQRQLHVRQNWEAIARSRWAERAACIDADPELFDNETKRGKEAEAAEIEDAKGICRRCAVVDICGELALRRREEVIRGGMTFDEQKQVRALRGIKLKDVGDKDE